MNRRNRKIKRWKRKKVRWKQEEKRNNKKTWKWKIYGQREQKRKENIIKLVETKSNANKYLRFPCSTLQKEGQKCNWLGWNKTPQVFSKNWRDRILVG